VLLLSVCAFLFLSDHKKPFWFGFAFFGWMYFLAVFGPVWFGREPPRLIVTTRVAEELFAYTDTFLGPNQDPNLQYFARFSFIHGCHASFTLIAGVGGGIASSLLVKATKNEDRST
jgi:hypothetical protein